MGAIKSPSGFPTGPFDGPKPPIRPPEPPRPLIEVQEGKPANLYLGHPGVRLELVRLVNAYLGQAGTEAEQEKPVDFEKADAAVKSYLKAHEKILLKDSLPYLREDPLYKLQLALQSKDLKDACDILEGIEADMKAQLNLPASAERHNAKELRRPATLKVALQEETAEFYRKEIATINIVLCNLSAGAIESTKMELDYLTSKPDALYKERGSWVRRALDMLIEDNDPEAAKQWLLGVRADFESIRVRAELREQQLKSARRGGSTVS